MAVKIICFDWYDTRTRLEMEAMGECGNDFLLWCRNIMISRTPNASVLQEVNKCIYAIGNDQPSIELLGELYRGIQKLKTMREGIDHTIFVMIPYHNIHKQEIRKSGRLILVSISGISSLPAFGQFTVFGQNMSLPIDMDVMDYENGEEAVEYFKLHEMLNA